MSFRVLTSSDRLVSGASGNDARLVSNSLPNFKEAVRILAVVILALATIAGIVCCAYSSKLPFVGSHLTAFITGTVVSGLLTLIAMGYIYKLNRDEDD